MWHRTNFLCLHAPLITYVLSTPALYVCVCVCVCVCRLQLVAWLLAKWPGSLSVEDYPSILSQLHTLLMEAKKCVKLMRTLANFTCVTIIIRMFMVWTWLFLIFCHCYRLECFQWVFACLQVLAIIPASPSELDSTSKELWGKVWANTLK